MVPVVMKNWLHLLTLAVLLFSVVIYAYDDDRFNYRGTEGRNFGPDDFNRVTCSTVGKCLGWPDAWSFGRGWKIGSEGNQCRRCNDRNCGEHKQGPVDLLRETGLPGNKFRECQDVHWMKYHDGACNWKDMTDNQNADFRNNFFIRPHALQVLEPIGNDGRLKCPNGQGGHFPKLDYSKGFPQWWMLSHMEIKTPSEFIQNGKRYDGQINYAQFYEIPYPEQPRDGPLKKDGTVTIFFNAYDNVAPDPFMDKMICQFRKTEEAVRDACGLSSVSTPYPGCWNPQRRGRARKLRGANITKVEPDSLFPDTSKVVVDEEAIGPTDFDFDGFIEEQIALGGGNGNWSGHPYLDPERHLLDYGHVEWHHYGFLINVRTEYYFRLEASQTVPPCQVHNHYRVMKDPLRVHPRQVAEIQRLLAERIAPVGSQFNECKPDTAGKPMDGINGNAAVSVARPVQRFHPSMTMTFCECKDWGSKWPEDRDWCKIGNTNDVGDPARVRDHPYNFYTEGQL